MRKIEEIYKDYYEIVYKYLFCLTHDKDLSEDLAQETFVKMIKNIDKFSGKSKLSSWLCEIAKNNWIDYLRKNKRQIEIVKGSKEDKEIEIQSEQNIEDEFIEKENKDNVYEKINSLDEISKKVMYLRAQGELSFKEIGDVLGKSENWARVTFYRGKQKLKEEL